MSRNVSTTQSPLSHSIVTIAGLNAAQTLFDLPWTVYRVLCRWQTRHEARLALKQMDMHRLADIGVTAKQAKREAKKPFWMA